MSEQNFNQSMKPFCGNSNATGMFIEANYPGGNYTSSLNSEANPEIISGSVVEGLMFAKNYRKDKREAGMKDDDIHYQYVDFIVRTALFHRELDKSTTRGSSLEGLRKAIILTTTEMLDRKMDTITTGGWQAINVRYDKLNNKTLSNYVDNNDSFFDFLNAQIIANEQSMLKQEDIVGLCTVDGNGDITSSLPSDLCFAVQYISPTRSTSPIVHFDNFLHVNASRVMGSERAQSMQEIINEINTAVSQYVEILRKNLNLNAMSDSDRDDKNIVKQKMKEAKQYKQTLIDLLTEAVHLAAKRAMNSVVHSEFITLDKNHHAQRFFENVCLRWPLLDGHARNFYRAHIILYREIGASSRTTPARAGWEDITSKLDDDFEFVKTLDMSKLRINLLKERPGAERVMFGATLPYIPDRITKMWYTDEYKIIRQVNLNNDKDVLRNLYQNVYMGLPVLTNGTPINNLPKLYDTVIANTSDFDVDDAWVVRNIIKSRKHGPISQHVSKTNETLLVEDMITKRIYHRDDSGLYRYNSQGVKVPYNMDNIKIETCAGSMLSGDQNSCPKFVRDCILNDDNNALTQCLNKLSDQNMFNVAHNELENMDPEIAIRILRTFKFGKNTKSLPDGTICCESISFDVWKETILNDPTQFTQQVRKAILDNSKLCHYLKGVVAFVNANPAILNENWRGEKPSVHDQIDDPYLRALGSKPYINPRPDDIKYTNSKMLVNVFNSPTFGITSPGRLINPFANTIIRSGSVFPPFMTGGGNSYETSIVNKINENGRISDTMELLFSDVHDDLGKAGYVLTKNDHYKLENSFDELRKTENRLNELHGMLRTLTDLNSLFKASGCVPHEHVGNVSIENLRNRKDTLAYLSQNINDVQNCINDNVNNQNAKCSELAQYYSALVDVSSGKSHSNVIKVSKI